MKDCKCVCDCQEKEFNGLLCKPIEQLGVAYKDIKVPKGWRLPTAQEGIDLVNNADFVKWIKFEDGGHDFYVEQPFKKNAGKRAAWFGCNSNYFYLFGNGNLNINLAARGVLLVWSKK